MTFESHSHYANHMRWKHKDNFESLKKISEKAKERHSKKRGELLTKQTHCRKCNSKISISYYAGREKEFYHCSRKCANSRGPKTQEQKNAISEKVKHAWKIGKFDHVDYVSQNKYFSSKNEREIVKHFKEKFPDDEWRSGGHLKFNGQSITRDMYSDKLKICFEYDGVWHFKDIHGQLEAKQSKDKALETWCKINGYRLIRIEETHFENFDQIENIIYESNDNLIKIGNSY
jgi:hypothetical protein